MSNYKYAVDILSSIASVIAIVTVLVSWYRNTQSALKVQRVVIHRRKVDSDYILVIKNRKPYPVIINSISCFLKYTFNVEKKSTQPVEYSETLSLGDRVFFENENYEISPNGNANIKIKGGIVNHELLKLLFTLQTSHGYHEIWCKNIVTVDITGKSKTSKMDFMYDTDSKLKAKVKFYWEVLINLFEWKS